MNKFLIVTCIFCFIFNLQGQCDIKPSIEGENVLCPNGSSTLTTQEFASYQWYSRAWGEDTPKPIENATAQNLNIDGSLVLNYISVEVTYDTCAEVSEEVLIDQWVFLLPVIQHEGEYAYIDNGVTYLCPDHEFSFELLLPYTTNISWYLDGMLIPGENTTTLKVTKGGNYTVSGAPDICPNYIVPLGLEVPVIILETTEPALDFNADSKIIEVSNAENFIQFDWYFDGELMDSGSNASITVENSGAYVIVVTDENGCQSQTSIQIEPSSTQTPSINQSKIYPNPAQNTLWINSSTDFEQYEIYNTLGQLIVRAPYNTNIAIGQLKQASYLIILKNETHEERHLFTVLN